VIKLCEIVIGFD